MNKTQFQKDREIDPTRLDMECIQQPERFFHYAEEAVEAQFEAEQAKLQVEIVQAHLELECRTNPDDFGLVKSTDSSVKAAVLCHPKYKKVVEDYNQARKKSRLLEAAVNTMETKRKMLEEMVKLHGQQYFAGPSVPHDLIADYKEYRETISTDVNNLQKSHTRKRGQSL